MGMSEVLCGLDCIWSFYLCIVLFLFRQVNFIHFHNIMVILFVKNAENPNFEVAHFYKA